MKPLSLLLTLLLSAVLAACAPAGSTDPAALAVESYLQALAAKDEARLVALSCPENEFNALLELDAFALVETRLEDLACTSAQDGTVRCQGRIAATYANEIQNFELSTRVYTVNNVNGDWLVCGYKEQ